MTHLIGQFECKADAKGRVNLPVALKQQLVPILEKGFVLKRSVFQTCLELYPKEAYDELMMKIVAKNQFSRNYDTFLRNFLAGSQDVSIEEHGIVLIPKSLISFAQIKKEVVLRFGTKLVMKLYCKKVRMCMLISPKLFSLIMTNYHNPVLLEACIAGLNIEPNGVYVDVTFGGGGHSRAILERLGESGRLIAFDQDEDALSNRIDDSRFTLVPANFKNLSAHLRFLNIRKIDGLLADFGVSSHQFDQAERGFSIRFDAPLDMRMNQSMERNARDIIAEFSAEELASLFRKYADLPNAYTLAKAIESARAAGSI
ncbi:MAG: 16S rRNA (cytosine(1402)-N(4))-methyltransferase RsmH, partial [Flavobacteriaceae bacterium]